MGERIIRIANILPEFDRRSLPAYALLALFGTATCLSFAFCRLDLSAVFQFWALEIAVLVIFVAVMLRRAGHVRIAAALETNAVFIVMAVLLVPVQYPVAMTTLPMVDRLLFNADHALGFDWRSFANFFSSTRTLWLLKQAYFSMDWQGPVTLVILAAIGRLDRAWRFVIAAMLAFSIAIVLFPLFPADGQYVLCGIRPPNVPAVGQLCEYPQVLHGLRDGTLTKLEPSMAVGMVSFPSAHAAVALLFVWAIWPIWWLRAPSIVLNVGLCAGAIVIGSHYFVDILGGMVLCVGCVKLAGMSEEPKARSIEEMLIWAAVALIVVVMIADVAVNGFPPFPA